MTGKMNLQDQRDKALAPSHRKSTKKKDTRRWCRGKTGVEHIPEVILASNYTATCRRGGAWSKETGWSPDSLWVCFHVEACATCGKHLKLTVPCPNAPAGLRQMFLTE